MGESRVKYWILNGLTCLVLASLAGCSNSAETGDIQDVPANAAEMQAAEDAEVYARESQR